MITLAIDPGPKESAYCFLKDYHPLCFEKVSNEVLRWILWKPLWHADLCAIEMIGHYGSGMPAGQEVFDTCVWIGRFQEALHCFGIEAELIKRNPVKVHLCGSSKAKDGNVAQALVDRFAPGEPNHGKGTKKEPGWFHGFAGDIWQAYALGVYAIDIETNPEQRTTA